MDRGVKYKCKCVDGHKAIKSFPNRKGWMSGKLRVPHSTNKAAYLFVALNYSNYNLILFSNALFNSIIKNNGLIRQLSDGLLPSKLISYSFFLF